MMKETEYLMRLKRVNQMNKKKIGDTWKAFLDALIEEDDDNILNYYNLEKALSFETALRVIQEALKENGIFEIGE